jgi:hypothetical protein
VLGDLDLVQAVWSYTVYFEIRMRPV